MYLEWWIGRPITAPHEDWQLEQEYRLKRSRVFCTVIKCASASLCIYIHESVYNVHIEATGLEQNSVSFPLVHQSKDADNDRVTVVAFAVDDDDNKYGLFIS